VNIDDHIILSQNTISEFFENSLFLNAVQNQKDEPERFNNCKAYLKAVQSSNEVQIEETENRDLGLCSMRILVGEYLPKKVCILRNGMMITDELNRLKNFPDFKEFVAVIICKNTKGNQFLRDMEPPRHDDFEPDRLPTEKRATGKRALSELAKWSRDMLKRHAKDPISEVTTLDELKDYFGDELSDGAGKGTEEINPTGTVIIRARRLIRKSPEQALSSFSTEENGSDGGGFKPGNNTGNGGVGGQSGPGDVPGMGEGFGQGDGGHGILGKGDSENEGQDNKFLRKLLNIRAVMNSSNTRKISFTPAVTGQVRLLFLGAGADTDHKINIIKATEGSIKGGCIIMNVEAGQRINLDVELEKNFDGSIKVSAYEI
jgi:hypothetical protein